MKWITDWAEIGSDMKYLVCHINARPDKSLYLGGQPKILRGWEVVRLMPRCYAALELPDFDTTQMEGQTP